MSLFSIFKPPLKSVAPNPSGNKLLHVLIRNREKIVFEGDALAISSVNNKGVFDVLPEHINFISIVKDFITIYKPDRTKQEYKLRVGLMKINSNKVEIYVGLADQIQPPNQK